MGKKRKPPAKRAGSPAWMTTWADLVSLLMCFFVLLFALSSIDEARFMEFAEAMRGRTILLGGALGTIFNQSSGMLPAESPPIPLRQNPEAPIISEDDFDPDINPLAAALQGRRGELEGMESTFRLHMEDDAFVDIATEIGIEVSALGEYLRLTFDSGMLFDSGSSVLRPAAVAVIDDIASILALYPDNRIAIHGHTDSLPINTIRYPSNFHLSAARSISVLTRLIDYHGFNPQMLTAVGLGEHSPYDTNETAEGRQANRRVEILVYASQIDLSVIADEY
jgi:chemotaxis protein MotB